MSSFVPYEKLSKKKKRELDRQRRNVWGISPITRRPENPKAYKRKNTVEPDEYSSGSTPLFFFSAFYIHTKEK